MSELLERPRQWIIKKALVQFLAREAEKRRLIQEGLDDVTAGRPLSMEQGRLDKTVERGRCAAWPAVPLTFCRRSSFALLPCASRRSTRAPVPPLNNVNLTKARMARLLVEGFGRTREAG